MPEETTNNPVEEPIVTTPVAEETAAPAELPVQEEVPASEEPVVPVVPEAPAA